MRPHGHAFIILLDREFFVDIDLKIKNALKKRSAYKDEEKGGRADIMSRPQ